MFFIVVSVVTFCIETLPRFRIELQETGNLPAIFNVFEYIAAVAFTFEYFGRLACVPFCNVDYLALHADPRRFKALKAKSGATEKTRCRSACTKLMWFLNPYYNKMNMIDFVSILPFFLEISLGSSSSGLSMLRILRLGRVGRHVFPFAFLLFVSSLFRAMSQVFRVFKLGKYSQGIRLLARVFRSSAYALYLLLFFVLIGMVIFGSLIFITEAGDWDASLENFVRIGEKGEPEVSPFSSIPACFWWVIVTATTVGYGDMVPISPFGKFVGVICMHSGVLVFALPITILSAHFTIEYERSRGRSLGNRELGASAPHAESMPNSANAGDIELAQSLDSPAGRRGRLPSADDERAHLFRIRRNRFSASGALVHYRSPEQTHGMHLLRSRKIEPFTAVNPFVTSSTMPQPKRVGLKQANEGMRSASSKSDDKPTCPTAQVASISTPQLSCTPGTNNSADVSKQQLKTMQQSLARMQREIQVILDAGN